MLKEGIFSYTDDTFSLSQPRSKFIRIQFNTGVPLDGFDSWNDRQDVQKALLKEFYLSFMTELTDLKLEVDDLVLYHGGKQHPANSGV